MYMYVYMLHVALTLLFRCLLYFQSIFLFLSFFLHAVQAGSHVREELVSTIIAMISENTEEHGYSVQRLFKALSDDISQHSLCQIAVWTIGEFGDLLVTAPLELEGETLSVRRMIVCNTYNM